MFRDYDYLSASKSREKDTFSVNSFFCSTSSGLVLDGSIDLFKLPHSKCRRFNLKEFWELRESNPGLLGEKRERYICDMPPDLTPVNSFLSWLTQYRHFRGAGSPFKAWRSQESNPGTLGHRPTQTTS